MIISGPPQEWVKALLRLLEKGKIDDKEALERMRRLIKRWIKIEKGDDES